MSKECIPFFAAGITPTGFILSLLSCYGGRASDKFISRDSGFYDKVMADRV